MASYSTIPATEDLGLTAAAPPKNTLGRKGLATLAAIDVLFTMYPKYKLSY